MAFVYRSGCGSRTESTCPEGRVLLIANHAGNTFAWDGAMLGMALFLDGDPPRVVRGMGEYLPTLPLQRLHAPGRLRRGHSTNCAHLGVASVCFPEGERGFVKTFRHR